MGQDVAAACGQLALVNPGPAAAAATAVGSGKENGSSNGNVSGNKFGPTGSTGTFADIEETVPRGVGGISNTDTRDSITAFTISRSGNGNDIRSTDAVHNLKGPDDIKKENVPSRGMVWTAVAVGAAAITVAAIVALRARVR
jgi:hypothetical protein